MMRDIPDMERYDKIDPTIITQKWLDHDEKFGVYIHSPFCASICKFCIYAGVSVGKYKNEYNDYYEKYLPKVIDFYKLILTEKTDLIDNWFFGGGTPSLMSPETMDSLFASLPNFKDHKAEKTFEIHPGVFQVEQLDVLKKYNFDTIIICQQTLDRETLIKQKRVPSGIEELELLTEECRKRNFNIGFDIIGFLNELDSDEEILQKDLKEVYDIVKPDQISVQTLYQRKDLTEKVIRCIYNSNFKKSKEYLIELFGDIDPDDIESVIASNSNSKCLRLYKKEKTNTLQYNLIDYMDPHWGVQNKENHTLAIGSFKNPSTQTHSNIGLFNYIECNYDNIEPQFKFVTNSDFSEELSYLTKIFNKVGNPPEGVVFTVRNKFYHENEICLLLSHMLQGDSNNKEHIDYNNKFTEELEKEKQKMFKKVRGDCNE